MNIIDQNTVTRSLDRLDARVASLMSRHGVMFLRVSLGVVFLWFGALKMFPELSPAEGLAGQTILALTNGLIEPAVSVPALGVWECLIGIGLLTGKALRLTLVVLLVHMAGTVTPLVLLPGITFARGTVHHQECGSGERCTRRVGSSAWKLAKNRDQTVPRCASRRGAGRAQ